jgi:hypothetical protein
MAFARAGWNPVGGQSRKGSAPQMWSYTSTDAQSVIRAAGYFNSVSGDVAVNDLIYCVSASGGTPVCSLSYVNANASGVVDVTDGLVVTATDSD